MTSFASDGFDDLTTEAFTAGALSGFLDGPAGGANVIALHAASRRGA